MGTLLNKYFIFFKIISVCYKIFYANKHETGGIDNSVENYNTILFKKKLKTLLGH